MFDILDQLEALEPERQLLEIDFKDVFEDAEWEMKRIGQPDQHIQLSTGYKLSRLGFFQFCERVNKLLRRKVPPKHYWTMPGWYVKKGMAFHTNELLAGIMRDHKFHSRFKVMLHGDVITAIHAKNYVDYGNFQLVKSFAETLDTMELTPDKYWATFEDEYLDHMTLYAIFGGYEQEFSRYGWGVMVSNSQNGLVSLSINPFVKSSKCDNSILSYWGRKHRHTRGIDNFAAAQFGVMPQMIGIGEQTYINYMKACSIPIEDMPATVESIKASLRLTKAQILRLYDGFESERDDIEDTLFNLVSGLTYMANFSQVSRAWDKMNILTYAGRLLELAEHTDTITTDMIIDL